MEMEMECTLTKKEFLEKYNTSENRDFFNNKFHRRRVHQRFVYQKAGNHFNEESRRHH